MHSLGKLIQKRNWPDVTMTWLEQMSWEEGSYEAVSEMSTGTGCGLLSFPVVFLLWGNA